MTKNGEGFVVRPTVLEMALCCHWILLLEGLVMLILTLWHC